MLNFSCFYLNWNHITNCSDTNDAHHWSVNCQFAYSGNYVVSVSVFRIHILWIFKIVVYFYCALNIYKITQNYHIFQVLYFSSIFQRNYNSISIEDYICGSTITYCSSVTLNIWVLCINSSLNQLYRIILKANNW